MSYTATVFKVMIASPSDVSPERAVVRERLAEWNIVNSDSKKTVLLPIGWETHTSPEMGDRPQSIINKQVAKDCDLLVGIFWTRLGTPTGEYESGTVEEIEEHIKTSKPVMLYFSDAPVRPDSVDTKQYERLKEFKESCKTKGIFETYSDLNDFKEKFYRQLQIKLNQESYFKIKMPTQVYITEEILQSNSPNIPKLSKEAQSLLKEASHDSSGTILRWNHLEGFIVQTNDQSFVSSNNPREQATWEAAIVELEKSDLIQAVGYKREAFRVTKGGYDIAELLNP
ncbi:MAG: DUF4062 domain-containing protein [Lentisphaerae bacterium GWF2_52_8]|nr:MAG: DUF4062 domain-containing protein [Lentisphaerae bacterium GWF2_52_8]